MKIRSLYSVGLVLLSAVGVFATSPVDAVTPVPANGALMPPSQFLPKTGFHFWRTLGQVELVKRDRKMVPAFAQVVSALDGKPIKVQGLHDAAGHWRQAAPLSSGCSATALLVLSACGAGCNDWKCRPSRTFATALMRLL